MVLTNGVVILLGRRTMGTRTRTHTHTYTQVSELFQLKVVPPSLIARSVQESQYESSYIKQPFMKGLQRRTRR